MSGSPTPANEADSLRPIPATTRLFSTGSYVLMWWSSLIVIQAFVLGQGFLPPNGKHEHLRRRSSSCCSRA